MIEKGWLKESALLNGTLFDNCNYKKIGLSSNLQFIKDNFKYVGENFAYEARSIHF